MPRAFTQNHYHVVFSTKHRRPRITPDIEPRLHTFIGGILRDLGCSLVAINGAADHVHVLARYPTNLSHADLVRHIKSRSCKWMHETFPLHRDFAWQEGYAGFTVSTSVVPAVEAYIAGQKDHHRSQDFRAEFLSMLRLNGVAFDEAEVFE
jgi:REP element-mobilizing transposase RayT